MCGIAGHLSFDRPPDDLTSMLETIAHRGPDDWGTHEDGPIRLGFRRLAIVDLSPAGHQPMTNEDGTIWLVFNGEIYNYHELVETLKGHGHHFRSQTDSEAIIHGYEQWGVDCLRRFNGMFALALWDGRSQTLFCARDRFGVKPFYYARTGGDGGMIFASEIKALLRHPRAPRRAADAADDLRLPDRRLARPHRAHLLRRDRSAARRAHADRHQTGPADRALLGHP